MKMSPIVCNHWNKDEVFEALKAKLADVMESKWGGPRGTGTPDKPPEEKSSEPPVVKEKCTKCNVELKWIHLVYMCPTCRKAYS
jgi:hypothetical protein